MERGFAFCLFAVAGLCGMTALLLFLAVVAGIPMPPKAAMLVAAVFAPYFAWRCLAAVPARQDAPKPEFDQAAAAAGARAFEGQIGRAVLRLSELDAADASVLICALSREEAEVFMMTVEGSANFRAWQALSDLGLMGEAAPEPEVAREPQFGRRFYLTPAGRRFVPDFLVMALAFKRNGLALKLEDLPPGFFEAEQALRTADRARAAGRSQ